MVVIEPPTAANAVITFCRRISAIWSCVGESLAVRSISPASCLIARLVDSSLLTPTSVPTGQMRCPQRGQGTSPVGWLGTALKRWPQIGHWSGMPSGVRVGVITMSSGRADCWQLFANLHDGFLIRGMQIGRVAVPREVAGEARLC